MKMVEKLLGFAIKANKIVYGTDNVIIKKVKLILISDMLSKSTIKKIYFNKKEIPIYSVKHFDELLSGRPGCKVIGITDSQMATAMENNLDSNYLRISVEGK